MKHKVFIYIKLCVYILALCALYGITYKNEQADHIKEKEVRAVNEAVYGENSDEARDVATAEIKKIAITFDDGPHSVYTKRLLDGLKERNVVATFFVVGVNIEENEELLQRMKEEGHLIGNHTYSHVELNKLNYEEQEYEILKTNQIIENIIGEPVQFIRPPFGSYDRESVTEGMLGGMFITMWDIDPRDWCIYDKSQVVQDVVSSVEDGDIILLHDIFESSVDAALEIIDILKAEGYEFVTVEELVF